MMYSCHILIHYLSFHFDLNQEYLKYFGEVEHHTQRAVCVYVRAQTLICKRDKDSVCNRKQMALLILSF